MSSMSYVSSYFHCVFSTKERQPTILAPLRDRHWPFLGGIARQNGMKAILASLAVPWIVALAGCAGPEGRVRTALYDTAPRASIDTTRCRYSIAQKTKQH